LTAVLNSLSWILGHLPLSWVRKMGSGFGRLLGSLSSRKVEIRQRVMDCLEVDAKEAKRILQGMYRNLGMTVFEFLRMPHMSAEERDREITFIGMEKLKAVNYSYLAVVGHTGNWELMAATASALMKPELNVVVKSLKPESLNTWITRTRSSWGTRVHDRRGSSRELLKVLKKGKPLGFILDQNAKRNWGVFVDFFGKPACTTDGLAVLAAMSKRPIFPVFCRRDPETLSLLVEIGDEIPGPVDRSDEEVLRVTQLCTRKIEEFIRQYPDQWIWMHRRWRTQPETVSHAA
jgi:KDO2-lipid IV(A) lauroyltransferase